MSKSSDVYRKRAVAIRKVLKKHTSGGMRPGLLRKQKALEDMADNEDWLEGKVALKLKI